MRHPSFQFLRPDPVIIESGIPGPTLMVLGGIHGDELSGVFAIQTYIERRENIKLESGRLILMFGNLEAIRNNTRQGEANLNRMFLTADSDYTKSMKKTSEYLRAMEIKPYLDQADVLLDLHSVANRDALPFVICERNGYKLVKSLPVALICSGLDTAHPGGTDGYMNASGKIGLCLETGEHTDFDAYARAKDGIWRILRALEMVAPRNAPQVNEPHIKMIDAQQKQEAKQAQQQRQVQVYFIYKNVHQTFQLSRYFEEFEEVKRDELIGHDGGVPVFAKEISLIVFPRNKEKAGEECFCLAK